MATTSSPIPGSSIRPATTGSPAVSNGRIPQPVAGLRLSVNQSSHTSFGEADSMSPNSSLACSCAASGLEPSAKRSAVRASMWNCSSASTSRAIASRERPGNRNSLGRLDAIQVLKPDSARASPRPRSAARQRTPNGAACGPPASAHRTRRAGCSRRAPTTRRPACAARDDAAPGTTPAIHGERTPAALVQPARDRIPVH